MVPEIGSTNAEPGRPRPRRRTRPEGTVLVAEHQVAGRGRLDRVWTSPPRAGLTVSFLLRPDVPAARRGWLPLLTGVALAESVAEVTGVLPSLKWPNDLLAADGRKLAGILAETQPAPRRSSSASASTSPPPPTELPDTGTSLAARRSAPTVDRGPVLLAFLRAVERRYRRWTEVLGDPVSSGLAQDYLAWSSTVGTDGRRRPARRLDAGGRRRRRSTGTAGSSSPRPQGTVELASGDVRHVR